MGCKLLYGVGNTGGMTCKIDGKMTPEYTLWSNMLARCYSEKYKTNNPHYVGPHLVSDYFVNLITLSQALCKMGR